MVPLLREQVAEEIMGFVIVADSDPRRGRPPYVSRSDLKRYESADQDALEVRRVMEAKGFAFSENGPDVCFGKGLVLACSDEQPRSKRICIAALRAIRPPPAQP